jgi:Leucine-rich repeat (LRR) protein
MGLLAAIIGFYVSMAHLPPQWNIFRREHMAIHGAILSPVSALVKLEEQTKATNPPTELSLEPTDYVRQLPETIGRLTTLSRLTIYGQGMRTLPNSIGELTHLQTLVIINTPLTSLPESIGNLRELEYLEIAGTNIRSLPASIGNLTHLKGLVLAYNQLDTLPVTLQRLTALVELDLTGNNLQQIPTLPPHLTFIFLGGNRIPRSDLRALRDAHTIKGVHY